MIKKIIINLPTNIGDTILAFPAIDLIRENYPQANITAVVSSNTCSFVERYSAVNRVIEYNKKWKVREKMSFCRMHRHKYDLMIDFKHSLLPLFLRISKRTPLVRLFEKKMHKKDRYIDLIHKFINVNNVKQSTFFLTDREKEKWDSLRLNSAIFIATASNSHLKRYPQPYLKKVIEKLVEDYPVVILGTERDRKYYGDIFSIRRVIDLTGKTRIFEVHYLLKNFSSLVICVDSSILHLASYLNLPVVALFGPTDEKLYGPYSDRHRVLYDKNLKCRPCQKSFCNKERECMRRIYPGDVLISIRELICH